MKAKKEKKLQLLSLEFIASELNTMVYKIHKPNNIYAILHYVPKVLFQATRK